MTWSFIEWSPNDSPGTVYDVSAPGVWERIESFYTGGRGNKPLSRIIEIARANNVKSVVAESRYIDLDWRSEHAAFYGNTFRRYPTVCHRLHLFAAEVPPDLADLGSLADAYRGYTVMRPLTSAPVGRTMIAPPPELMDGVRCEAEDTVDLFGWPLTITAMPFVSQDEKYLRCAHSALWMALYHAHLRHGLNRCLPRDIHDAAAGGVIFGRQVPSDGLTIYQMLAAGNKLGLSPARLPLPRSEDEENHTAGSLALHRVVSRYVDSQLPPIVYSTSHTWVISAFRRVTSDQGPRIELWRHDDARGPYIPIQDPWNEAEDHHKPWKAVIAPLLKKMYVSAEQAERAGHAWFTYLLNERQFTLLAESCPGDNLGYRTYAVGSREYKSRLTDRGVDQELALLYRLAKWPRYVWVVEAVDPVAQELGQPDVVGEAIFDSTSATHDDELEDGLLALHMGDFAYRSGPDHGEDRTVALRTAGRYATGRPELRRTSHLAPDLAG